MVHTRAAQMTGTHSNRFKICGDKASKALKALPPNPAKRGGQKLDLLGLMAVIA